MYLASIADPKPIAAVDVYAPETQGAVASPAGPGDGADDDGAADDRVAEEFRRDFLEAMSRRTRRRRAPAPAPSKYGPKKDEEVLKGPKLGGSRNARSAMRDLLLEQQERQKGKR